MPELDAEHRNQIADLLKRHLPKDRYDDNGDTTGTYCTGCDWTGDYFADGDAGPFDDHVADALAPLVAGWLADAWDAGRDQGQWDGIVGHGNSNPYRGGDDG